MPELDDADDSVSATGFMEKDRVAQDDPRRNPVGIYSGMTKRLAISDDTFVEFTTRAGDTDINTKKVGKLLPEAEDANYQVRKNLRDYQHKRTEHS
jgi:hypothetical protein